VAVTTMYTEFQKTGPPNSWWLLCQILTDFQNTFTVRLTDKFATKVIVKDPTTP